MRLLWCYAFTNFYICKMDWALYVLEYYALSELGTEYYIDKVSVA